MVEEKLGMPVSGVKVIVALISGLDTALRSTLPSNPKIDSMPTVYEAVCPWLMVGVNIKSIAADTLTD